MKQWQARIVELEDEVMGLSDKCKAAEKRADQSQVIPLIGAWQP